jgi:excisionase family DNA binding protein
MQLIEKRLYSVKEAGRYLGISGWAVRHLIWSGKLPSVRQGRRVLIDILDMNEFINKNKSEVHHGDDLSPQEARSKDRGVRGAGPVLDEVLR